MLNCIRTHGPNHIYLGLNAGSLGFLMNDISDPERTLSLLEKQQWKSFSFPRLHLKGTSPQGETFEGKAVNDVYVIRTSGITANLRLEIDDIVIVEKLSCDGLIISTALGSTAYNYSAGGTPCHPLLQGIHITPICPHKPRLRSFMVPNQSKITIDVLSHTRRPVQAVSDGISHGPTTRIRVDLAPQPIQLAFLDDHHFTETLFRKVLNN